MNKSILLFIIWLVLISLLLTFIYFHRIDDKNLSICYKHGYSDIRTVKEKTYCYKLVLGSEVLIPIEDIVNDK